MFIIGKLNEALDDANKAIDLDPLYEKAYIRKTTALESLKLKRAITNNNEDLTCPVLTCFITALKLLPNSALLHEAMRLSFPWIKDKNINTFGDFTLPTTLPLTTTATTSSARKKKPSAPTKAQRDSCEPVDIRGASGAHELRINGVYVPTEEISGGWPIYRKRTEEDNKYGYTYDSHYMLHSICMYRFIHIIHCILRNT